MKNLAFDQNVCIMFNSVLHPVFRSASHIRGTVWTIFCLVFFAFSTNGQVNQILNLNSSGKANLDLSTLSLDDCFTSNRFIPSAATGDGHAMWLSNNPIPSSTTDFVFTSGASPDASFIESPDGTAILKGKLVNTGNPADQWEATIYLSNKSNWSQWSGLGRSYKDEKGLAGNNYTNWEYYIEDPNLQSQIVGKGINTGKTVEITHMPSNYNYGFQIGVAANNKNVGFGMSGWFSYSLDGTNYYQGDFNLDLSQVERTITRIASIEDFDCSNLGVNTVTITSTDQFNESCTQSINVEIKDITPPTVVTKNITKVLTNGRVTITAAEVLDFNCGTGGISVPQPVPGAGDDELFFARPCTSDNCSIVFYDIDKKNFDCTNAGVNIVTATVRDQSGNVTTATATVTIIDNSIPTVKAKDITVELDENGNATITPQMIDNGSTGACGNVNLSLNKTTFDCSNVGTNQVTLIATNGNGVTRTAVANVTVVDNIAPVVVTKNITLNLDQYGQASIADALDLLVLCDDANIEIPTDNGGGGGGWVPGAGQPSFFVPAPFVEATCTKDNCTIVSVTADITDFNCTNLGQNTVNVTVTDASGNSTTETAIVTINDIIAPTVITKNIYRKS